jgi:hypothetical protein
MAMAEPSEHLRGDETTEQVKHVLDAARGALAQEFQIAERLDAKARGQMTLAGAWYAVVQAVAGIALRDAGLSTGWKAAILGTAGLSGLALVVAVVQSYQVWKLRNETDLNPEAIRDFGEWVRDDETDVGGTLVGYYASILEKRQATNKQRSEAFDESVKAWFGALGLTLVELLTALVAVISA